MVNHCIPSTLNEALQCIHDGTYMILAGGTDLMVQHRSSAQTPPRFKKNVCYINHLKELKTITQDEAYIHIGAMVTYEDILHSKVIPSLFKEVIMDIASPGIRYMATLVGNIGNASPAGDALVYLYAVDALVCIESLDQKRTLPIQEVIIGPRKTVLKPNELITEIKIPIRHDLHQSWVKVGPRKADAISKVSFIGLADVKDDQIVDCRMVWGAVYNTVLRRPEIEAKIIGLKRKEISQHIHSICDAYEPWIQPIDDQRSTKVYRKKVAMNLLKDFMETLRGE